MNGKIYSLLASSESEKPIETFFISNCLSQLTKFCVKLKDANCWVRNTENCEKDFGLRRTTLEVRLLIVQLVSLLITQRRLNVDCYNISPDLNFILLYECEHDILNGTKYYVYEIFSTNFYALTPNDSEEVELQKILWSPASYEHSNLENRNNNRQKKVLPSSKAKMIEKSKISQAVAFIHDFDIYYKPRIHSDLVIRITTNGERKSLLEARARESYHKLLRVIYLQACKSFNLCENHFLPKIFHADLFVCSVDSTNFLPLPFHRQEGFRSQRKTRLALQVG